VARSFKTIFSIQIFGFYAFDIKSIPIKIYALALKFFDTLLGISSYSPEQSSNNKIHCLMAMR